VLASRSDGRARQAKPASRRAEPEANLLVLLRIRRRRADAKDPLAVGVLFFNGLLVSRRSRGFESSRRLVGALRRFGRTGGRCFCAPCRFLGASGRFAATRARGRALIQRATRTRRQEENAHERRRDAVARGVVKNDEQGVFRLPLPIFSSRAS